MAKKRFTLTDLLNDLTFRTIYNKYKLLAQSTFEWEGLPDCIEQKYIEKYLFRHGKAVFFKEPHHSFMCLKGDSAGKVNVYNEPLFYNVEGMGFHKKISTDECVVIDNNPLRIATKDIIMFYVNKITEAERTMDVNVKSVKTPVVFVCDDKDVLSFKRLYQQVDGNTPAVYADKGLNLDAITTFKTDAKFMGNDLMDYKKSVENEMLTFLGYDNLAVDKKERVNLSEANSNNQITESFADLQLKSRQKACDEINKMFGLNITVKRKEIVPYVECNNEQHNEVNS